MVTFVQNLYDLYEVDAVYTDFSQAFYKARHATLVRKLSRFGVYGNLLRWLQSCVYFRTQCITIDRNNSEDILSFQEYLRLHTLDHFCLLYLLIIWRKSVISYCTLMTFRFLYRFLDIRRQLICSLIRMSCIYNLQNCFRITFSPGRSSLVRHSCISFDHLSIKNEIKDIGVILDPNLLFESRLLYKMQIYLRIPETGNI